MCGITSEGGCRRQSLGPGGMSIRLLRMRKYALAGLECRKSVPPTKSLPSHRPAAFHDVRSLAGYTEWVDSGEIDDPDDGTAKPLGTCFGRGLEWSWTVSD